MIFTLIVRNNHLTNCYSALEFARAALAAKHKISGIYFLFAGAYVANQLIDMPSDEFSLPSHWSQFALQNGVPLIVCSASGLRRGITQDNLAAGFSLGSIGQLVESCALADRVVSL